MRQVHRAVAAIGILTLVGCAPAAVATASTAAAARHSEKVTGKLVMEGGPISRSGKTPVRPLSGTVTFRTAHRPAIEVRVPKSGRFRLRLAPGSYRATATTPGITGPHGKPATCPGGRLRVRVGQHPVHVVIACVVP